MSPFEPQIKADGLGFSYEEVDIFTDLTFSIERNQSLLLLGPSGSGKSTLAFCLNKLYPEAVDGVLKGTSRLRERSLMILNPVSSTKK